MSFLVMTYCPFSFWDIRTSGAELQERAQNMKNLIDFLLQCDDSPFAVDVASLQWIRSFLLVCTKEIFLENIGGWKEKLMDPGASRLLQ